MISRKRYNMTERERLIEELKECKKCHEHKLLTQFRKYKKGEYNCIRSYCKSCDIKYTTEHQKLNPKQKLQWDKNYRQTPHGKEALKRRSKKYLEKYPERKKVMNAVQTALRNGSMMKQVCEFCSDIPTDAHHPDYSKPLEVVWLCKRCHVKLHQIILADRKRIVEPLVKLREDGFPGNFSINQAIDETLKNAGVEL